ncbi:mRNA triphosphatase CET1 [Fistulina hepatica ATCC 64428]|uniref:mRNA-capping enzyme subunit beta n=1 Tax=Fistulina hepatica ATCC 64428 TaxID=1128425 RepID=A0A0D7A374_9AGAR|nr:mRNA triphosphatase CET1 [Fistulina hepatica ATCC 64428]
MSSNSDLPPLSLSILGVEPLDEFIREIADFIHHVIMTRPDYGVTANVEVEAKVGILKDKQTNNRLMLPVLTETSCLACDIHCSDDLLTTDSQSQHKHYNTLLNRLLEESQRRSSHLSYKHLRLIDSFYPSDQPGDREKIRVTRDEKTGSVIESMRKVRLGDLNVYSPKRAADWRVSVNLEIPVSHPIGSSNFSRRKDRMRYSHEEFMIDLTQVTMSTQAGAPPELLHELEIEIARSELLVSTAMRRGDPNAPEHERNAFDEIIRAFVNNARILVRNAG